MVIVAINVLNAQTLAVGDNFGFAFLIFIYGIDVRVIEKHNRGIVIAQHPLEYGG